MPYLFISSSYPSHKADEVVKKYIEILPKYPSDPTLGETVVNAVNSVDQGYISFSVFEVKKGKYDEAVARWMSDLAELRNIEGFEYSIETWATNAEAFAAIGMKIT